VQLKNLNRFPFAPDRCPVFYGWPLVAAGALGILMSVPGQTIGVSVFTDSLITALPLTRGQLSAAYMFGTLGSALLLPAAGRLYDRAGSRIAAPVAAASLALVLLLLTRSDALAKSASLRLGLPASVSAFIVIVLCFLALRFWGQGILSLSSHNMIAKWFDRKRGLASGCTGVFVAFGFSIAPLALDSLIRNLGWRGAWIAVAVVVGGLFTAVALAVYRDNPEACGLSADGAASPYPPTPNTDAPRREPLWTRDDAIRTWTFWTFSLSLALYGLYITGLTFHIVSIFDRAGMTRTQAVSVFLPISIIAVAVHLLAGWLSDRLPLIGFLIVMLIAVGLSSVGLAFLDTAGPAVALLIAGNGVAGGLFALLSAVSWAKFFGRAHLGAIGGLHLSVTVMSSALGPVLFSQSLDWAGTYRYAAFVCLVGAAALMLAATQATHPPPVAPGQARP